MTMFDVSQSFSSITYLMNDALTNEDLPIQECLNKLTCIFKELSPEERQALLKCMNDNLKLSCNQILNKHTHDEGQAKIVRELELQVLFILQSHFLCLQETQEISANHELSDWVSELVSRLGICFHVREEWKAFLKREIVDRYGTIFGRTLFHVYLNLGLEPPDSLPNDDSEFTESEPRVLDENYDEVDGIVPQSPRSCITLQSPQVSRDKIRQSLPRALFTDPIVIPTPTSEVNLFTSTPSILNSPNSKFTNSRNILNGSKEYRKTKTIQNISAPQLVLIPCQRSKRKCRTPIKCNPQLKRELRKKHSSSTPSSTGRQKRNSSKQNKISPKLSQQKLNKSNHTTGSSMINDKHTASNHVGQKKNSHSTHHRRSVHETPNPEKSYPRWERAKLAAAEKTKNKAIIVDESPIKPSLSIGSPLRKLRRANSMLASLVYIETQEAMMNQNLQPIVSQSSSLPPASDDSQPINSQIGQDYDLCRDSCLSRAMSRAERWKRRQLEEELSLSQFTTNLIKSDQNLQSPTPFEELTNHQLLITPTRLTRRNSNLFANMISPEHQDSKTKSQLSKLINQSRTPRKNIFNFRDKSIESSKHSDYDVLSVNTNVLIPNDNNKHNTSTQIIPNQIVDSNNVIKTPKKYILQSPSKQITNFRSTPRCGRRNSTIHHDHSNSHNLSNRKRVRYSSGNCNLSNHDKHSVVPISPQIFDEEAMFLGRDEFLCKTTPNLTNSINHYTRTDENELGAEIYSSSIKRSKRSPYNLSTYSSPQPAPIMKLNTQSNQLAYSSSKNLSNNLNSIKSPVKFNSSKHLLNQSIGKENLCNDIQNKSEQDLLPFLLKSQIKPQPLPLHLFDRNKIESGDLIDNQTLSSQSASGCITFRKELFGNTNSNHPNLNGDNFQIDLSNDTKFQNPNSNSTRMRTRQQCNLEQTSSLSSSSLQQQQSDHTEHSRHQWDESSTDLISLSPVLKQFQWNIEQNQTNLNNPPKYSQLCLTNLTSGTLTRIRPRRSLFQ